MNKKMVKIDNKEIYRKMDPRKLDKIQIFPSKQHCGYSKMTNQLPKLTKTIMSPLTTMPPKKLNMNAPQIITIRPNSPHQANMKANEKPPMNTLASNNNVAMQFSAMKNNYVSKAIAPVIAPKNFNVVAQPTAEPKVVDRVKETAAGYRSDEISLNEIHPYITCFLCRGYLIEATTIVECLHTFCHSCLMKHLSREASLSCPQCKMIINKSKTNIKYDATIQSIVYKLVPGLYHKELLRRRAFYKQRPAEAKLATPEERGDDTEHLILSPLDLISLSLDYAEKETLKGMESDENVQNLLKPKYLNCPAIFKVEHMKKFIVSKFLINCNKFNVEISYKVKTIVLPEHYTLMDVAYIYTWKKEAPMPFFFRIIAKNSKCDELPEVALRRSPTTTLPNAAEETHTKKKSVSFKEEVESIEAKPEQNSKVNVKSDNSRKPSDYPLNAPRIETIKLKLDVSNNNVSIIKNTDSMTKSDIKQKQRSEKKEKKNKLENLLPKYTIDNERSQPKESKKDEYEFDDDIEQQKLGFLNTFQLTAKKILNAKANMKNDSRSFKSDCTSSTNNKNNLSQKQTENNFNKRKSKEPVKSAPKKYKFHEMKSVGEGNKFLFTKTGDGHEITFDMSPKPLGSKPPLSKVKSDIMLAQQRADAKANKDINKPEVKPSTEQHERTPINNQRNIPIKPKKLPMLLPKQPSPVASPSIAPSAVSPTAFVIKKPDAKKDFVSSEISVTKINDQNHHLRVYGPKSSVNKTPSKETPNKDSISPQFKSPDGFAQPLPPKVKSNVPKPPPTQIFNPYGPPMKLPKNIPENMQTPYGCRTPIYVPSSPSYTPNFGALPKYKYTNPNAYASNAFSMMQSMFGVGNAGKISPPINVLSSPKASGENPKKRPAPDNISSVPMKRKSPSPSKSPETESKAIEILNKIHFPKSLSVTLTNEQEENKKEQLRSQKQGSVNNNIEIIKLSEEKDLKAASANPLPKSSNTSPVDKTFTSDKKGSEAKKVSPKVPALLPNPESFQRAFLESINAMQNIEKNSAGRKSSKTNATETSAKDEKDKIATEIKTEENTNFEQKGSLVPKSFSKISDASQASVKKNISLTPPPTKPEKMPINSSKAHTPPPDPNVFASNAAHQTMLLQLMGMNPFAAAVKSSHLLDYANMNIDAVRRQMMFETLRQNAMALQHQIQQQQQKTSSSSHTPSTTSSGSSPSSKR